MSLTRLSPAPLVRGCALTPVEYTALRKEAW